MTADQLERRLRRLTTVVWVLVATMALHGAWRGRRAAGRKVGSSFTERPSWLYAVLGGVYLGLMRQLWRSLPGPRTPRAHLVATASGAVLSAQGAALMIWGRVALGDMYNVSSAFGTQLYSGHRLVTSGPFALVRHPMYVGALLGGLGAVLVYRTWAVVFLAAHWPVLVVRARHEEAALAAEFGEQWPRYRRQVPAWLPSPPWSRHAGEGE
jgi:protein-S-isoprenylcysteine O-methyltransferase Ste14